MQFFNPYTEGIQTSAESFEKVFKIMNDASNIHDHKTSIDTIINILPYYTIFDIFELKKKSLYSFILCQLQKSSKNNSFLFFCSRRSEVELFFPRRSSFFMFQAERILVWRDEDYLGRRNPGRRRWDLENSVPNIRKMGLTNPGRGR